MTKIRMFEAFSGYGSQAIAAKRLQCDFPDDVEFEFVGISEIEPNAIKAYAAIHGGTPNFGDISKIDWSQVPDFDLLMYSFPCTDISNAGKQAGFSEGSETRSSLLWECEKAIKVKRPKYLLMENVKALVQKKFMPDFQRWIALLESYGYANFWQVLNAKDFGCAQNRERVFMVSIWGGQSYNFPQGFPLDKCVEDYMVDAEEIDESYFIDQERVTNKVLSDILDQPNVRAEMENLYHKEMQEKPTLIVKDRKWRFVSIEVDKVCKSSQLNIYDTIRFSINLEVDSVDFSGDLSLIDGYNRNRTLKREIARMDVIEEYDKKAMQFVREYSLTNYSDYETAIRQLSQASAD